MRAGRCLPRRRAVFVAGLLAPEPPAEVEVDEGLMREIEAVERGERGWGRN